MTTFEIYLNRAEDLFRRFTPEAAYQVGDTLEHVHGGAVLTDESESALLNKIFEIYNISHPADYTERSLSVGDVVKINGRTFVCERTGWSRIHRTPDPHTQPKSLRDILLEDEHWRWAEAEEELLRMEEREYEMEERYGFHGAGIEYYDDFDHGLGEFYG